MAPTTSTAIGRLLLNLLASLAEFELEVISERVRAGMDRARREGKHIGRPSVFTKDPSLERKWAEVLREIQAGRLGIRAAARALKVSHATIVRLVQNAGGKPPSQNAG